MHLFKSVYCDGDLAPRQTWGEHKSRRRHQVTARVLGHSQPRLHQAGQADGEASTRVTGGDGALASDPGNTEEPEDRAKQQ